jgi:hypothetical protein
MKTLFKIGRFRSHTGLDLNWKVECDALTPQDWAALAAVVAEMRRYSFSEVEGVPNGGLKFAEALRPYAHPRAGTLLIVDDVMTTGESMEDHRQGREAIGVVAFSRTRKMPHWVRAIWMPGL